MSYTFLTPGMDAMTIWNQLTSWDGQQSGPAQADKQAERLPANCEDDCHFCCGPETD